MAEIVRPDPADYITAPWTDQNGQRWLATAKGQWAIYVDPPEAGGAATYAELTDAATVDLPATNTPLATALSGKLSTATAASTYSKQVRDTISLSANLTVTSDSDGKWYQATDFLTLTFPDANDLKGIRFFAYATTGDFTIAGDPLCLREDESFITSILPQDGICEIENIGGQWFISRGKAIPREHVHSGADITTGNIAVARIATALTTPGPIGGATPAAISATTVTASGAVIIGGGTAIASSGATGASMVAANTPAAARTVLQVTETAVARTTDATARTVATFVVDDTLAGLAVTSGRFYEFLISLRYSSTTVGMQWKIVTPGHDGAVNSHGIHSGPTGAIGNLYESGSSTDIIAAPDTATRTARRWFATGIFRATATGTCAIHWATNTSGGSATLLTGSLFKLRELPTP